MIIIRTRGTLHPFGSVPMKSNYSMRMPPVQGGARTSLLHTNCEQGDIEVFLRQTALSNVEPNTYSLK